MKIFFLIIEARREIFKTDEHPDVAKTINNIAGCYGDLGDDEKALNMHKENFGKKKKQARKYLHKLKYVNRIRT